jgi:hypothetical protein
MEQAKARFRQVVAGVAATGESLDKVKGLLECIERDWPREPVAVGEPRISSNGRPVGIARQANRRFPAIESLDASSKLSSGERRILTALAQYSEGRSKVQVAVLTGYAVSGGGFNNYLGALRGARIIKGDGDRLRITESGMRELGSWEPLPAGSGLVGYWRARLGKAERLILERLPRLIPMR